MDKPKKEPPLLNQNSTDSKLCLSCGFPNRHTDTHCMYCQTNLIEDTGLISWVRQTYYILRWRWQLKQKRESLGRKPSTGLPVIKAMGYFVLGALLSGVGLYAFTEAMAQNSFSGGLIALLLLVYGGFTLFTLFAKK